jgi:hypothetical protein
MFLHAPLEIKPPADGTGRVFEALAAELGGDLSPVEREMVTLASRPIVRAQQCRHLSRAFLRKPLDHARASGPARDGRRASWSGSDP